MKRRFLAGMMAFAVAFTSVPQNAVTALGEELQEVWDDQEDLDLLTESAGDDFAAESSGTAVIDDIQEVISDEEVILDEGDDLLIEDEDAFDFEEDGDSTPEDGYSYVEEPEDMQDAAFEEDANPSEGADGMTGDAVEDAEEEIEESDELEEILYDLMADADSGEDEDEDPDPKNAWKKTLTPELMAGATDLQVDKTVTVDLSGSGDVKKIYRFVAPADGDYQFQSSQLNDQEVDSYGYLYDSTGIAIDKNDDFGSGYYFSLTKSMRKDDVIYLAAAYLSDQRNEPYLLTIKQVPTPAAIIVSGIDNIPDMLPVGSQLIYEHDAKIRYTDGSETELSVRDVDLYGHELKFSCDQTKSLSEYRRLKQGDAVLSYTIGNCSLSKTIHVLSLTDYAAQATGHSLQLNKEEGIAQSSYGAAHYIFTAPSAGNYTLSVDQTASTLHLLKEKDDFVTLLDHDWTSSPRDWTVSVYLAAGESVLLETSNGNAQGNTDGTVLVSEGTTPAEVSVKVPEKSVYPNYLSGMQVTISYEDESIEPDVVNITGGWGEKDRFGNLITIDFSQLYDADGERPLGVRELTVSCGNISRTVSLNIVSMLEGMDLDGEITFPCSSFQINEKTQYGSAQYFCVHVPVAGEWTINAGSADLIFYDRQDHLIAGIYGGERTVTFDEADDYLMIAYNTGSIRAWSEEQLWDQEGTALSIGTTIIPAGTSVPAIYTFTAPADGIYWLHEDGVSLKTRDGHLQSSLTGIELSKDITLKLCLTEFRDAGSAGRITLTSYPLMSGEDTQNPVIKVSSDQAGWYYAPFCVAQDGMYQISSEPGYGGLFLLEKEGQYYYLQDREGDVSNERPLNIELEAGRWYCVEIWLNQDSENQLSLKRQNWALRVTDASFAKPTVRALTDFFDAGDITVNYQISEDGETWADYSLCGYGTDENGNRTQQSDSYGNYISDVSLRNEDGWIYGIPSPEAVGTYQVYFRFAGQEYEAGSVQVVPYDGDISSLKEDEKVLIPAGKTQVFYCDFEDTDETVPVDTSGMTFYAFREGEYNYFSRDSGYFELSGGSAYYLTVINESDQGLYLKTGNKWEEEAWEQTPKTLSVGTTDFPDVIEEPQLYEFTAPEDGLYQFIPNGVAFKNRDGQNAFSRIMEAGETQQVLVTWSQADEYSYILIRQFERLTEFENYTCARTQEYQSRELYFTVPEDGMYRVTVQGGYLYLSGCTEEDPYGLELGHVDGRGVAHSDLTFQLNADTFYMAYLSVYPEDEDDDLGSCKLNISKQAYQVRNVSAEVVDDASSRVAMLRPVTYSDVAVTYEVSMDGQEWTPYRISGDQVQTIEASMDDASTSEWKPALESGRDEYGNFIQDIRLLPMTYGNEYREWHLGYYHETGLYVPAGAYSVQVQFAGEWVDAGKLTVEPLSEALLTNVERGAETTIASGQTAFYRLDLKDETTYVNVGGTDLSVIALSDGVADLRAHWEGTKAVEPGEVYLLRVTNHSASDRTFRIGGASLLTANVYWSGEDHFYLYKDNLGIDELFRNVVSDYSCITDDGQEGGGYLKGGDSVDQNGYQLSLQYVLQKNPDGEKKQIQEGELTEPGNYEMVVSIADETYPLPFTVKVPESGVLDSLSDEYTELLETEESRYYEWNPSDGRYLFQADLPLDVTILDSDGNMLQSYDAVSKQFIQISEGTYYVGISNRNWRTASFKMRKAPVIVPKAENQFLDELIETFGYYAFALPSEGERVQYQVSVTNGYTVMVTDGGDLSYAFEGSRLLTFDPGVTYQFRVKNTYSDEEYYGDTWVSVEVSTPSVQLFDVQIEAEKEWILPALPTVNDVSVQYTLSDGSTGTAAADVTDENGFTIDAVLVADESGTVLHNPKAGNCTLKVLFAGTWYKMPITCAAFRESDAQPLDLGEVAALKPLESGLYRFDAQEGDYVVRTSKSVSGAIYADLDGNVAYEIEENANLTCTLEEKEYYLFVTSLEENFEKGVVIEKAEQVTLIVGETPLHMLNEHTQTFTLQVEESGAYYLINHEGTITLTDDSGNVYLEDYMARGLKLEGGKVYTAILSTWLSDRASQEFTFDIVPANVPFDVSISFEEKTYRAGFDYPSTNDFYLSYEYVNEDADCKYKSFYYETDISKYAGEGITEEGFGVVDEYGNLLKRQDIRTGGTYSYRFYVMGVPFTTPVKFSDADPSDFKAFPLNEVWSSWDSQKMLLSLQIEQAGDYVIHKGWGYNQNLTIYNSQYDEVLVFNGYRDGVNTSFDWYIAHLEAGTYYLKLSYKNYSDDNSLLIYFLEDVTEPLMNTQSPAGGKQRVYRYIPSENSIVTIQPTGGSVSLYDEDSFYSPFYEDSSNSAQQVKKDTAYYLGFNFNERGGTGSIEFKYTFIPSDITLTFLKDAYIADYDSYNAADILVSYKNADGEEISFPMNTSAEDGFSAIGHSLIKDGEGFIGFDEPLSSGTYTLDVTFTGFVKASVKIPVREVIFTEIESPGVLDGLTAGDKEGKYFLYHTTSSSSLRLICADQNVTADVRYRRDGFGQVYTEGLITPENSILDFKVSKGYTYFFHLTTEEEGASAALRDKDEMLQVVLEDPDTSYTWDGEEKSPAFHVTSRYGTILDERHFTAAYEDNVEPYSGYIVAKGIGAYQGLESRCSFPIKPIDLSEEESTKISIVNNEIVYDRELHAPDVIVWHNGIQLSSADYQTSLFTQDLQHKVSGTAKDAGDYRVEVNGIRPHYSGGQSLTWHIEPRDLNDDLIRVSVKSPVEFLADTMTEVKPAVEVYMRSVLLKENEDYTITYADNTRVGEGHVILTGLGNYTGERTVSFDIIEASVPVEEVQATALDGNTVVDVPAEGAGAWYSIAAHTNGSMRRIRLTVTGDKATESRFYLLNETKTSWMAYDKAKMSSAASENVFAYDLDAGSAAIYVPAGAKLSARISRAVTEDTDFTATKEMIAKENQWYAFVAEQTWQYRISADSGITVKLYDENGNDRNYTSHGTKVTLELEQGNYFLAIGAESKETVTAQLAKSPKPEQLRNVAATPQVRSVQVSWGTGVRLDTKYRVYRENAAGVFELLKEIDDRDTTSYTDTKLDPAKTYSYYVTAVYGTYAEGDPSETVSAQPQADRVPPVIGTMTPAGETRHNGAIPVSVLASDNIEVAKMSLWIRPVTEPESAWGLLLEKEGSRLDTSIETGNGAYADGAYELKVEAVDTSGNEANAKTQKIYVDNSGPSQVTGITTEHTSVTIALHWNDVPEDDRAYFVVQRKEGEDTWRTVAGRVSALGEELKTGLVPKTPYTFRVYAVDDLGNAGLPSEPVTVTTDADTTAPVITKQRQSSENGRYKDNVTYTVTAQDDYGIRRIWYEYSYDGKTWERVEGAAQEYFAAAAEREFSQAVDVTGMREGLVWLRAQVVDFYENASDASTKAPLIQIMADFTAPAAPTTINTGFYGKSVRLSWNMPADEDLDHFILTRKETDTGQEVTLASSLTGNVYTDTTTDFGQSMSYTLQSVDQAGNISEKSAPVTVVVPRDEKVPVIHNFTPASGKTMNAQTWPKVYVTDNGRLKTLYSQYSADGLTWTDLEPQALESVSQVVTLAAKGEMVDGDGLYLKVWAEDYSGNVSDVAEAVFGIDRIAPQAENLKAELTETGDVALTWTSNQEQDLAGYYVYRRVVNEDETKGSWTVAARISAKEQTDYTLTDVQTKDGVTLEYMVRAYDYYDNYADTQPVQVMIPVGSHVVVDETVPRAFITCNQICETGVEYEYRGDNSWDDSGEIKSYLWDFGDDTVSTEKNPIHIFEKDGYHKITLTVTDPAGNEGSVTVEVQSLTKSALGQVQVTVKDQGGQAVPGAEVYFDLGSEHMNVLAADGAGQASFTVQSGMYPIGAYADGYLPVKQEVNVAPNAVTEVTLTMEHKDIVTGTLEVNRMTLEDIEAAGINLNDPANQNFFKYTIKLTYGLTPVEFDAYCDEDGNPVGDQTYEDDNIHIEIIDWIPEPDPGPDSDGIPWPSPWPSPFPSGVTKLEPPKPVIAVLEIPGEASWLKDFFDVQLTIINEASADFALDNCYGTLHLPGNGALTPMDTNYTTSSLVQQMGTIYGQQRKSAHWILRGDKPGSYDISADFDGVLRDFKREIHRTFEASEPVEVRDGSDLWLDIWTENALLENCDGAIRVGFRNEGAYDIYCPSVKLEKVQFKRRFKTSGSRTFKESETDMRVLKPGEEIWSDYIIDRDDWEALIENEESMYYLHDQVLEKLSGMEMNVKFTTVQPMTICADRIEVYLYDDPSQEVKLIDVSKSDPLHATIPSLLIRTYTYDENGDAIPTSMDVTIKDEYLMGQEDKDSPDKKGRTVTTDANGTYVVSAYEINDWIMGLFDDNKDNKLNYKAYNIAFCASRAYKKIPVVAKGNTSDTGLLRVIVMKRGDKGKQVYFNNAEVTVGDKFREKTKKRGTIEFKGVDTGNNLVTVKAKGYETKTEVVKVSTETEIIIEMEPADDTKRSYVTEIRNNLSANSVGNLVVVPESTVNGSVTFTLERKIADGETFRNYVMVVQNKEGKERRREEFTSNTFVLEDIGQLNAGDQIFFAVAVTVDALDEKDPDYIYTSRLRDSNILVIEKPAFLGESVIWLKNFLTDSKVDMDSAKLDTDKLINLAVGDKFKTKQTYSMEGNLASEYSVKDEKIDMMTMILEKFDIQVDEKFRFPINMQYDFEKATVTINVILSDSNRTTTNKQLFDIFAQDESGITILNNAAGKTKKYTLSHTISGSVELAYNAVKDTWFMTVYLVLDGKAKIELGKVEVKVGYASAHIIGSGKAKMQLARTPVSGQNPLNEEMEGLKWKSGTVGVDLRLAAGGMLGTQDLASIGLYAKSGIAVQLAPFLKITQNVEVGWEGKLFWLLEKEDDIINQPFVLYSDESASARSVRRSSARYALADPTGPEAYEIVADAADSEYLDASEEEEETWEEGTVFVAAEPDLKISEWVGSEDTLANGVYYDAKEQMITLPDGRVLMVYTDFNGKDDSNPVNLFYTLKTAEGWTKPKAVDAAQTAGTVGINPDLRCENGQAVLTWMNMKEVLSDMTEITYENIAQQIYENMQVHSAVYDPQTDTWIEGKKLDGEGIVTNPLTVRGGDSELTVWISNLGNTETATEKNPDVLRYSLDGFTSHILSMEDVGEYDIVSLDASAVSDGFDLVVQTLKAEGESLVAHTYLNTLRSGVWQGFSAVGSKDTSAVVPVYQGNALYYIQDDAILRRDSAGKVKQALVSETLENVSELAAASFGEDGCILSWVWNGNESVIYASLSEDGRIFGEPFEVVRADGLIKAPKITQIEGGWLFAYEQALANGTNNKLVYSLHTTVVSLGQDLFIEETSTPGYLYAGQEVRTSFTIGNRGLAATNARAVISAQADGSNPLAQKKVSGLTGTITWTVPEEYRGESYYLVVLPSDDTVDINLSDNAVKVGNELADLVLGSVTYLGTYEGKASLRVHIANDSIQDCARPVLTFTDTETDEVITAETLPSLKAGSETDVMVEMLLPEKEETDGEKVYALMVELSGFDAETVLSNNLTVYSFVEGLIDQVEEFDLDHPAYGNCGAFGESIYEGDNVTWTIKDGVLTLTGEGETADYASGQALWFSQRETITKIIVEEGITTLGGHLFEGFTNVSGIKLPETITTIADTAFEGSGLEGSATEITFDENAYEWHLLTREMDETSLAKRATMHTKPFAQEDIDAAKAVEAQIEALQIETPDDDALKEADAAFKALSPEADFLVSQTNKDALTAAWENKKRIDRETADRASSLVNVLTGEERVEDAQTVTTAEEAYLALTEDQKALYSEEEVLKLEGLISQAKASVADDVHAREVAQLIRDLPSDARVTHEEQANQAKSAFEALTEGEQKKLGAEKLDELKKLVEAAVQGVEDDRHSKAVALQIRELPDLPGEEDEAAVSAAAEAYAKLTDGEKAKLGEAAVEELGKTVALAERSVADDKRAREVEVQVKLLTGEEGSEVAQKVQEARSAYDGLTPGEQAKLSDETKKTLEEKLQQAEQSVADDTRAKEVKALVEALSGEEGSGDAKKVEEARNAFKGLTSGEQAKLSDETKKTLEEKLQQAEKSVADDIKAREVASLVDALTGKEGVEDAAKVEEARSAYDALTNGEKAKLDETTKKRLEDTLAAAEKSVTDDRKANEALELLQEAGKLEGTVDPADRAAVTAAREAVDAAKEAYESLSSDQQVRLEEKLGEGQSVTELEETLKSVDAEVKGAEDTLAVADATAAVDALPAEPGVEQETQVKEAREAFDNLTQDQITKLKETYGEERLEQIENVLKEAENSVSDDKAARAAAEQIRNLPAQPAEADAAAVQAARETYDALTTDQKAKLGEDTKALLETMLANAEKSVADAKAAREQAEADARAAEAAKAEAEAKARAEAEAKAKAEAEARAKAEEEAKAKAEAEAEAKAKAEAEAREKAEEEAKAEAKLKADAQAAFALNVEEGAKNIPIQFKKKNTKIKAISLLPGDALASAVSGNKKVVTASVSGNKVVLKGLKNKKKATITVTTKLGASVTFTVKVQKAKVTTKKITAKKTYKLKVGETLDLSYLIKPITTGDKLTFKTSKKKVATVGKKTGLVKAKKAGKTKITITSGKKKKVITVTVIK